MAEYQLQYSAITAIVASIEFECLKKHLMSVLKGGEMCGKLSNVSTFYHFFLNP